MGFQDDDGSRAGCYPNQLQSIALNGHFAYVVSVCASPEGPLGVKATTTACVDGGRLRARSNLHRAGLRRAVRGRAQRAVRRRREREDHHRAASSRSSTRATTARWQRQRREPERALRRALTRRTRPRRRRAALSALRERHRASCPARRWATSPPTAPTRCSACSVDADDRRAASRSAARRSSFIDLAPAGIAADKAGKNPIGIAIGRADKKLAFVANDVSRNVTLLDFNTQAVAGGAANARASCRPRRLPRAGSRRRQACLRGKRFFNTGTRPLVAARPGLGRVPVVPRRRPHRQRDLVLRARSAPVDEPRRQLRVEARRATSASSTGPRSSTRSTTSSSTRAASPAASARSSSASARRPRPRDRIDIAGLGHAGLNGSAAQAADPANPLGSRRAPASSNDWARDHDATCRASARRAARRTSTPTKVEPSGKTLFSSDGACQGCHGGEKWTISRRFYTPSAATNAALDDDAVRRSRRGFPDALLPAREPANQVLRFAGGNAAAFDQILCALRPVGTFNVAEPGVGIAELRADMKTPAQGDGNPPGEGRGYNLAVAARLSTWRAVPPRRQRAHARSALRRPFEHALTGRSRRTS